MFAQFKKFQVVMPGDPINGIRSENVKYEEWNNDRTAVSNTNETDEKINIVAQIKLKGPEKTNQSLDSFDITRSSVMYGFLLAISIISGLGFFLNEINK